MDVNDRSSLWAQRRFLARRAAQQAEDNKRNCDCAGCNTCKGFEPGCLCTLDPTATYLSEVNNARLVQEQTTDSDRRGGPAATQGATEPDFPF